MPGPPDVNADNLRALFGVIYEVFADVVIWAAVFAAEVVYFWIVLLSDKF